MRFVLSAFLLAAPALAADDWRLVWSDEFEGPANTKPDAARWAYDLGASGWGNAELQNYTDLAENAALDGQGRLVIRALQQGPKQYTSARLKTLGKFTVTYGKIEARMRLPRGQGIWPAFWMLGADIHKAGWPACGEIDIMEHIGKEPSAVYGTIHGPGYSGGKAISGKTVLPEGQSVAADFHTFAAEWAPGRIDFFFDGARYHTVTQATLPPGSRWAFDKPFFLLLNLAVGGRWPGYPDATSQFPQELIVDYVRVYQRPGA
jgi:beta-glucanase (GH16 family)